MENKLVKLAEQSGIEKTRAQEVLDVFQPFFQQAAEWEEKSKSLVITSVEQKEEMKLARSARLNLKQIRCDAETTRKKLKEKSLAEGRIIDGMAGIIKGICEPIESHLEEQEKFAERQEAARIAALKAEREEQLKPFGVDTQFYNLSQMSEQAFVNLLDMTKTAHAAKLAEAQRLEEERIAREKKEQKEKAERERLDREERAKQAAENERLKKEAEERERQIAAERAKAEAERKAIEEKARKEAEERAASERKRLAKEKEERDKREAIAKSEKEKAEAEIRKANEAAEKARRELQAKKDEDDRQALVRKCQEEARKQIMESASDSEKLKIYITELQSVVAPELITGEAKRQLMIVRICLEKSIEFAEKIK